MFLEVKCPTTTNLYTNLNNIYDGTLFLIAVELMFTTNHLYVSPNVSTVQYCVELPLGSTRARTLRGMLLTKVCTLSRGICCRKFWTTTPSYLRFTD